MHPVRSYRHLERKISYFNVTIESGPQYAVPGTKPFQKYYQTMLCLNEFAWPGANHVLVRIWCGINVSDDHCSCSQRSTEFNYSWNVAIEPFCLTNGF